MFDRDILFYGKHATYLRELAGSKQINIKVEQRKTFFNSNIETVLAAAAIGFIKKRKAKADRDNNVAPNRIFFEAVSKHKDELELIYRIIMLLDDKENLNIDERMDKAFRYDGNVDKRKPGDEAFYDYVRGGIEYLHDELYSNSESTEEDLQNAQVFIDSFKNTYDVNEDMITEIDNLCMNSDSSK